MRRGCGGCQDRVDSVRGGCKHCAEVSIEGLHAKETVMGEGVRARGVRGTAVCTCETLFERSSGILFISVQVRWQRGFKGLSGCSFLGRFQEASRGAG